MHLSVPHLTDNFNFERNMRNHDYERLNVESARERGLVNETIDVIGHGSASSETPRLH